MKLIFTPILELILQTFTFSFHLVVNTSRCEGFTESRTHPTNNLRIRKQYFPNRDNGNDKEH